MIQGLILLGFTILFFILGGILHLPVAIPALVGSLLLLAISGEDIVEMLEKEVEWPTLVFFIGLFMVIAGAEETGLIQVIANWVKDVSGGNLTAAIVIVLWVSAIASAFIDNIPFTATMLPIIAFLNQTIPGAESGVLWWSLALGACLGGNGTMIGASRQRGHRGPGGKGRLPHLLPGLHEGLLVAHDDHRHHLHGLSVDRLLTRRRALLNHTPKWQGRFTNRPCRVWPENSWCARRTLRSSRRVRLTHQGLRLGRRLDP